MANSIIVADIKKTNTNTSSDESEMERENQSSKRRLNVEVSFYRTNRNTLPLLLSVAVCFHMTHRARTVGVCACTDIVGAEKFSCARHKSRDRKNDFHFRWKFEKILGSVNVSLDRCML